MHVVFVVVALVFSFVANADTYYIKKPHKVVGIDKNEIETIDELISTGIESQNEKVVENEADAKYVLQLKYIKLGKAVVINADKFEKGKLVYSNQMKAEKLEELDTVTYRIARAIVFDGVAEKREATVKDVTESEAIQGTRRKDTVNRWYVGMGPAWADKVNASRGLFNIAIGYFFEIDPSWALKIVYDGTGGNFNYVALGANYYFTDRKQSPVVTAETGWGGASTDDSVNVKSESINSWVLGAGAGYQFFRTSKVNLEILAHIAFMTEANHIGNPAKYGVRVGIYW